MIYPMIVYMMLLHNGLLHPNLVCTPTTVTSVQGRQAAAMYCEMPPDTDALTLEDDVERFKERKVRKSWRPTRAR